MASGLMWLQKQQAEIRRKERNFVVDQKKRQKKGVVKEGGNSLSATHSHRQSLLASIPIPATTVCDFASSVRRKKQGQNDTYFVAF
ncbi:hypothetical protein E2542_SST24316 [Spatholobus suberectus]|nr:hypothetical protein E2542_SST24316 [Spatholobus suberectus]